MQGVLMAIKMKKGFLQEEIKWQQKKEITTKSSD